MTERQDPEIIAMRACWKALRPFGREARARMLRWLDQKASTAQVVPALPPFCPVVCSDNEPCLNTQPCPTHPPANQEVAE